jgi:hypothetical protein
MSYSIDPSKYLHTYEVYRIPEGSSALNAENASIVKSDGDSPLVLTEESRKQLIKDRLDYGAAIKAEQDKVYEKQEQMDYAPKPHQAEKTAQMTAQMAEWEPEEEDDYQAKLKALCEAGNELVEEYNRSYEDFMEAQSAYVLEIDSDTVDLSSIRSFYKMGGGLAGAIMGANV